MSDIRIVNLEADSYLCMAPEKMFSKAEKENKNKHCLERRRTFTTMVYDASRISGTGALAEHRRLASHPRFKPKQEYSKMCGFVGEMMSLTIWISNTLLLRGP